MNYEMNEHLSVVEKVSLEIHLDDHALAIVPEHLPVICYTIHQAIQLGKVFWAECIQCLLAKRWLGHVMP